MANESSERTGRRPWLLIVGIVLAVGAVAAAAGIYWWTEGRYRGQGETTPVLVDTSVPGGAGAVSVEAGVSLRGGGGLGEEDEGRLVIQLSEGEAQYQATEPLPVAVGQPLSEEEIAAILARLPELELEPQDQVDFRLPEDLVPPPRPGQTIEEPFPPPPAPVLPPEVAAGPLEVLRFAPEGEIPLAPFVNVTFNQPMVPLATLEALSAEAVPVRLEPALPGTWKWLGTKTLSFEYDSAEIDRLPMATEYVVTVPAGTESATGGVLAEAVSWSFSTPPPKMIRYFPSYGPQPLTPVFVVGFDQRIDRQAVLNSIQVTADGQAAELRLATDEEVAADKDVSRFADHTQEGRWLAFVAVAPLPADASIVVNVGPGTPSAEGPLVTQEVQRYDFHTYAPLRVDDYGCSWYSDDCRPLVPFYIQFNNPIDVEAYQESMLRIEPELPGATVNVVGSTITIKGSTVGRTDYRVTVAGTIKDIFGQTLGKDHAMVFKVGPAEPMLVGPEQALVTLDPSTREPVFTVYAINYSRLKVRAYAVEPSDWGTYLEYLREQYRDDPPEPPGRQVMDKTITIEAAADSLTEANIDLSEALGGDTGHLVVVVEPAGLQLGDRDRYGRVAQAWVQVTQIGLDAFVDHSEMVVWTTALQDGAPLAGVTIEADGATAVTGEDGTVRLALPDRSAALLVARAAT
jgi:hypothetical protein